jgi:hypothetical protein
VVVCTADDAADSGTMCVGWFMKLRASVMIGRHRRREQHRLPRLGDLPKDSFDIGQEAEVEHLVGLVEHQHGDAAELQVSLLSEVEERPGVPTTTSAPARSASICGS